MCIYIRAVQANREPAGTDQPDRNRPVTTGLTPPTGRWRVPNFRTRLRRVEWRVSSSKTRATRPARQNLKEGQNPATICASQLRSGHVWPSFTQIYLNPHSDMLKSGEASPDLPKLGQTPVSQTVTRPNLSHISIDPVSYRPNLVRFGQIWRDPARFRPKSGDIRKPETDRFSPENRYDPTRLIWNVIRVGCG